MRAFSSRTGWALAGGVIVASLLFGPSALSGCGTVDRSLAGQWSGLRPYEAGEDETLARNIAAVELTLEPSGSFKLVDGGLPFTGKWRRVKETLTFDVETLMGRPISTQPDAAKKVAGAFGGRVDGQAIYFRGLTPPDVRLDRQPKRD